MNTLFPWHYNGHARGLAKYWVSAKCLALNALHLAVYVTVAALAWSHFS